MALSATCIIEVQNGGSDTLNGGLFNPGATLNSNLAATSATGSSPVVTSATYNFVAGDVGHWLFIKSGTNWTPGWYQIASVSAGAATLTAGVGTVFTYVSGGLPKDVNSVAGCATTGSPTSGSWAIDYSQVGTVPFSLTGLTTAAANAIILTASATVAMVGNGIRITGGTNFTNGVYQINSVSAGVSLTVDRNCTTAAGSAGTAGVGGALASIGAAGGIYVNGIAIALKYNASTYDVTSATANVAGGCFGTGTQTSVIVFGYDTSRYVLNSDPNRPTVKASGISTAALFSSNGNGSTIYNVIVDGNSLTAITPTFKFNLYRCWLKNCSVSVNAGYSVLCEFSGFTVQILLNFAAFCIFHDNTAGNTVANGGGGSLIKNCIFYNNTGIGINFNGTGIIINCISCNNGSTGFSAGGGQWRQFINCVSINNGGAGYFIAADNSDLYINCAAYNNTSGSGLTGIRCPVINPITLTGNPYVDSANGNFALNNTAGAGALLRALSYPSTFPAGLTANYLDIGAAQHQDAGGGSSGARLVGPSALVTPGGVL